MSSPAPPPSVSGPPLRPPPAAPAPSTRAECGADGTIFRGLLGSEQLFESSNVCSSLSESVRLTENVQEKLPMITSLRGTVLSVGLTGAVIETGGVGLSIQATPTTLSGLRVGEEALVHTELVVREDSLTLFGFADADERELRDRKSVV